MTSEANVKTGPLFHSPLGLFDFQAEGVAHTYWAWTETEEPVRLALWDTGIGKTILALATAALCFEDDALDVVVVVAESNKVLDWAEVDAPRFTDLRVGKFVGSKRKALLGSDPQLLVTSWATSRNDICDFKVRSKAVEKDGILTEYLKGKRVGFIFDEFSALRSRGTKTYLAWEHLIRTLRKGDFQPRMLGLTATTVEGNPEDHFNACRILSPIRAGRVQDFDPAYVSDYDIYGNPTHWKNLTRATMVDPGVLPLNERFGAITLRKKKTDPDVVDQFPSKMENAPTVVPLAESHKRLYDQIEEIFSAEGVSEDESRQGFSVLKLLADHPMALFSSRGKIAKQVVQLVGPSFIEQMTCAKVASMLEWQQSMQQQQTVIFTFYGQAVLPLLRHSLGQEGYQVSINHGGLSLSERQRAQDAFKAGDTQIFLSSDAGAKGLNLGCGSGLLHYELPILYSTYVQRSDRIHRIDSKHPSVTIDGLIARDTVEEPLAFNMLKRNKMAEQIHDADYDDTSGDPAEGFLRARDRIALLRRAVR